MALCCDLSFGILSLSSYVDIKTINIVSFDVQKNENKLLRCKSKQVVDALRLLEMPLFLGFLKKLKEDGKLQTDDIENELLKYIKLNKAKIRYMMIQNYKYSLKPLKELELLGKQEIKNATERKFNILNET